MAFTSDPERHIEEARANLMAHLDELRRRLTSLRARLDVRAQISAHPLAAVGAAFAVGALLGMRGVRGPGEEGAGSRIPRMARAALGALAVRLVKELAMRAAAEGVSTWWERRRAMTSEIRTSYAPGVEQFLEH